MKQVFIALIFILSANLTFGQSNRESRLAQQYYQAGEYEKAVELYQKLYKDKNGIRLYYQNYFDALLQLEDYETIADIIKKAKKDDKDNKVYQIDEGYLLKKLGKEDEADKVFDKVVDDINPERFDVMRTAGRFMHYQMFGYVVRTYEMGQQRLRDPSMFNYDLAYSHNLNGNKHEMMRYLIEDVSYAPDKMKLIQNELQRNVDEEDYGYLEELLLKKIAKAPRETVFPELLVWLYMHMNDYDSALIQARALDLQNQEDGRRLINLAREAASLENYDVAIRAYQHVIDKGANEDLYVTASLELINVQRDRIIHTPDYTEEDLRNLEKSYFKFIKEYPQNYTTAYATQELANLEALYIHDVDTAIGLLTDVLEWPRLQEELKGEIKIDLGDYYILQGEMWESTLLYGQVEKAFRGGPLAEMAKFKNAKLSYYKGDFEWAQTQLKILKASTSELISNDAIDLSVFISDNLNLDTTTHPMMLFARAELMIYQNQFDEAITDLDAIVKLYPGHGLTDDVQFKKAEIMRLKRDFESAEKFYLEVADRYADQILADNALNELGDLYLHYLNDKEKAAGIFERLILDYSNSTFTVEARKKFRMLRGDDAFKP